MGVYRFANRMLAMAAGIALGYCSSVIAADTVQVDIKSLLNARSVSTFSNGKIYTWQKGIDGNGGGDGYITHSTAVFLNRTDVLTLPDSARFPANANHPTMILNYSNLDSTHYQTHFLSGGIVDSLSFAVPSGNYSKLYLAVTSSEGGSTLDIILSYSDAPVKTTYNIPDYAQGLLQNTFYVDSNMAKWSPTNTVNEAAGHNVNGLVVVADVSKTLTNVKVIKRTTGSYFLLWGVTGVGTISTIVAHPSVDRVRTAPAVVQFSNGISRVANVRAGSTLTLYSPSGEIATRFLCANGGIVSVGAGHGATVKVAPGMYVCELRAGGDRQTMQMLVPR